MIKFPYKRIFGTIGANRCGKDVVANYLKETRNFIVLAFADQVKEEFGISKEEFETLKGSKQIDSIRQQLWDFSERIRKDDPQHFINIVKNKALSSSQSVIITDIRTDDEMSAFRAWDLGIRVYWVYNGGDIDSHGFIAGSKLNISRLSEYEPIKKVHNDKGGLFSFYKQLDQLFFEEDMGDLLSEQVEKDVLCSYLDQFEIRARSSYES